MADSLSETKITYQPEEEDVVSVFTHMSKLLSSMKRQVQKPEHLTGALQMLQVMISTRLKLGTFSREKERNLQ